MNTLINDGKTPYQTRLTDLPEEILIVIINQLDIVSMRNLYDTCSRLRSVICLSVVKHCNLSMNSMATVNTLKLNFFKDISNNLVELNMKGVEDLCKSALMPVLKRLNNLKLLDVSYTNITILDLIDIPAVCPKLKDLSVNFRFTKTGPNKLTSNDVINCQNLFKQFSSVHFVGSVTNLIYSKLAILLLKESELQCLTYSIPDFVKERSVCTDNLELGNECFPQLKQFSLHMNFSNDFCNETILREYPLFSMIDSKKYEFIALGTCTLFNTFHSVLYPVFVSPFIYDYLKNHFPLKVSCAKDLGDLAVGNIAVIMWSKELCNFDDNFFKKCTQYIKQNWPCYLQSLSPAPKEHDWFLITPSYIQPDKESVYTLDKQKKRRVAHDDFVLNYDNIFIEKQNLLLSIIFVSSLPKTVALSANCNYLRKLTFLSLTVKPDVGIIRFSSEFFNLLFRCCNNLVTLNVQSLSSQCVQPISRSLPLSTSIKNIRLVEKRIDFSSLFSSFSQSRSLQNIHIVDKSQLECDINPRVIENCVHLYSIYIEAAMNATSKQKLLRSFNLLKKRNGMPYINVILQPTYEKCTNNYRPFMDVFKLSPMKQFSAYLFVLNFFLILSFSVWTYSNSNGNLLLGTSPWWTWWSTT